MLSIKIGPGDSAEEKSAGVSQEGKSGAVASRTGTKKESFECSQLRLGPEGFEPTTKGL